MAKVTLACSCIATLNVGKSVQLPTRHQCRATNKGNALLPWGTWGAFNVRQAIIHDASSLTQGSCGASYARPYSDPLFSYSKPFTASLSYTNHGSASIFKMQYSRLNSS
jgi:hypothetical protein